MSKLPYLNLGCGTTYNVNWINVDFVSTGEGVIGHNLLEGIPFNDNTFEVVYHSHVLEHFPKDKAHLFIKECYRVLKPGGIIRVAIPDLERITRNYLKYLEESLNNVPLAAEKYEWTILEMYDQVVRIKSGGDMLKYIKDKDKGNDAFLLERNGKEAEGLINALRKSNPEKDVKNNNLSFRAKIKERLLQRWLGKDFRSLMEPAIFRSQGEIHQWMYDRYSLKLLLQNGGFKDTAVMTGFESSIQNWKMFELDGKGNEVRKPDSLFMEARK